MGLLPSIASTLSFSMPAGPVGMVWGWLVASCFIFIVSLAMVCFNLSSLDPISFTQKVWTGMYSCRVHSSQFSH